MAGDGDQGRSGRRRVGTGGHRFFGPRPGADGTVFRLWAPDASAVALRRPDRPDLAMAAAGDGFFELRVPDAGPGSPYMFVVGDIAVPDPASRGQADDVEGWSLVSAPLPPLREARPGRPWQEAVIAELHVGTASAEGTFAGLAAHLDRLADAGFTVIELMPVADFYGARGWGYDGVLPFAPDTRYGSVEALRALIEAAHARGLAVMLDVVYNHFGPRGNFLSHYAGRFFSKEAETLWGAAIALDDPLVRAFFVENVSYWLGEVGFDGLRFDAVHAFATEGAATFLDELARAARAEVPGAYLVLENDGNEARWLERDASGRPRRYDAQWNDDIHHAFHVLATGEAGGYLDDYATDPVAALGRALSEGFVFQGDPSPHRKGATRGEASAHLPPHAFCAFAQNHDHIGNRPLGDRLAATLAPETFAFLRFVILLSPQVPLLFMGEDMAATTPFPYFADYDGPLGASIRDGRKREFAAFFEAHGSDPDALPDPLAEATFEAARLDWSMAEREPHASALVAFRSLTEQRRRLVWPLTASAFEGAELRRDGAALLVTWRFAAGRLVLALGCGAAPGRIDGAPARAPDASVGTVESAGGRLSLGPWSGALWSLAGEA